MVISNDKKAAGVSVIICCYNSATRLPDTLKHLAAQVVPEDLKYEVLLINNASTDRTSIIAAEIWQQLQRYDVPFRIIDEQKPGQMHARIKGAQEAGFEYLVFCDDDNWLNKNYVYYAFKTLHENSTVAVCGGQNHPVTDAAAYPDWWEPYKDKYALGVPAPVSGDVTHRGFILGAGLTTRRSLFLEAFSPKYPSLLNGRNGESLSTGDDFEYCKRTLLWGYHLYYEQEMKLQHFIPKERLTVDYRNRLMKGIEEAGKILSEYDFAQYIKQKHGYKNKFKIWLLAPMRIFFAKRGWSNRKADEEALKLFYLTSSNKEKDPKRIIIKQLLNHR